MSRLFQITILLVFIVSTAMRCNNGALKIGQEMNLRVNPNPIPIENDSASFEIVTSLPSIRTLKKIDSLVFEISHEKGDHLMTIGTTKMMIPTKWNKTTNLHDTVTFELTNFSVPDQTTLYFQVSMHKNGKTKTTEPLPVGHFKNKKDGR